MKNQDGDLATAGGRGDVGKGEDNRIVWFLDTIAKREKAPAIVGLVLMH